MCAVRVLCIHSAILDPSTSTLCGTLHEEQGCLVTAKDVPNLSYRHGYSYVLLLSSIGGFWGAACGVWGRWWF